ncbi:MAG: prolyl oligopeptidase family serine peptidase [Pseudonocardia sp.]
MTESFPRRQARTRRFTLGAPRGFTVTPDGARVLFLRSRAGTDPVTCLWSYDVAGGQERLLADPRALGASEANLPPEERARRERSREQAGGIVGYHTDRSTGVVAFTLAGQLYLIEPDREGARHVSTPGGVVDPRPDPAGDRVAYCSGGGLWLYDRYTGTSTALAEPESDTVRYGLADFVAAEEMGRMRGYWWSPDSGALLVARTDDAAVGRWHVADPANPERPPTELAYPAAGTANVVTGLFVQHQDGSRTEVAWNPGGEEYLVDAHWDTHALLITVQPRDQRALRVLAVDPLTGATSPVVQNTDERWVDIVPGVPAHLAGGALVWARDAEDARRLVVDGADVTPAWLGLRSVLDVDGDTVLFTANAADAGTDTAADDGTDTAAARVAAAGDVTLWTWSAADGARRVSDAAGVFGGRRRAGVTVVVGTRPDSDGATVEIRRADEPVGVIRSYAEAPGLVPRVFAVRAEPRGPRTAVVLPTDHTPGDRLPVLLDPYGGPHAQRVLNTRGAYLTSQWFADQGFAVVVADGRGTPGRGPAYERAVVGDLAEPVLEDQVSALHAAAAEYPDLDLGRVGIRGWSFGGYLAALAVLRRPEVFHAAVAGAPVTDWALYDTHYTERYLGRPDTDPDAYARSSLIDDAPKLTRPLMLIHGLADDNVVAAHTLRLSGALLAAGRQHTVLPLSGVTHMTPQEEVAENLLLLQVDFLRSALGLASQAAKAPRSPGTRTDQGRTPTSTLVDPG